VICLISSVARSSKAFRATCTLSGYCAAVPALDIVHIGIVVTIPSNGNDIPDHYRVFNDCGENGDGQSRQLDDLNVPSALDVDEFLDRREVVTGDGLDTLLELSGGVLD
jgi:hypothetical protein